MHFFLPKNTKLLVLHFVAIMASYAFCIHTIYAQKHEVGISVGALNNTGDVNMRFHFKNYRPAAQILHRYNISKSLCTRFSFLFGQIYGSEKKSKFIIPTLRQATFKGTLSELAFMLEYNFINYRDKKTLYKFSPFFSTGISIYASSPKLITNSLPENKPSNLLHIALPIGIGIKYAFNRHLNLAAESIARKSFNDHLDGISNAMIGKQTTGNPLDNDWYFYTGIGITYTFYKLKCPQPQEF